ncbi:MAG: three-Cys-motif partner protein TcmP [Alphaproteobacteria bacterium]|nr:three-Cys-motif partner protein TcmP [Alphaproteobacteria bacterium]MCL2889770.1 three-Cys-motif partner protein TcmP [Alphaproteobacteria bacterium]
MNNNSSFFVEQSANSEVKMKIVLQSFKLWLSSVRIQQSLFYIDLFAGPGVYDDGTLSTPICVLQEICADRKLAQKFCIVLNDNNIEYMAKLRHATSNILNFKYIKSVTTSAHDNSTSNLRPKIPNNAHSFVFLDPFGWKGMNRSYVRELLRNPNCEIVLLFSFNQFHRFKDFDAVCGLFDDLFDAKTLAKIREFCRMNPGYKNERFILDTYVKSLTGDIGNCHIIPFKFQIEISLKTSHYLIFIVRDHQRASKLQNILKNHANYKDDILCYSAKCNAIYGQQSLF